MYPGQARGATASAGREQEPHEGVGHMPADILDEQVIFPGEARPIEAFMARPRADGAVAAVIVVHEIWGLVDHVRDVARRFAAEGYVALAPDLYTGELREVMSPANIMAGMQFLRQAPPEVQRDPQRVKERLGDLTPDQQRALTALMGVMSPERRADFARDLAAAVSYLAGRQEVDGTRIGSVGFCMGGGLSGLLATLRPDLRATVIFYGENPPLNAVPHIRAAMLGLYGGEDARITETVPALVAAMATAGKRFDYHVYPGAQHAFFNESRPTTYHAEAARDSWRRVLGFFARELGAGG